ncbi:retrograde regulation protein 2 [Exophiala viscosa]|uniref:Retrograde regulation protein 2 n=1 Tax=Exophiala viscosa TaxID=2486360 RepID=A0AAN6E180_9EURO|nr:retrograde regulation protein 2 [Exophiala viscosa]KAI1624026.1 retrograde regulation protein 2 [Exophiala viscosa]
MSSSKSDNVSASSFIATPAPTVLTPESRSDESPVAATRSSRELDGDAAELRRLHHHLPGHGQDNEAEPSESEDDVDKYRHVRRLKRAGTESKEYTDEEENAVVRKLDRKLVLFLAFLYLLSFLDRSNIGNARIAGLEQDLSLSSAKYDWLLTAFYITYIAFEWMILLYRLIPAHAYISICVLSWGVVASLQSLATSFPQLLILRAFLGITEAAFGPGVPFYMTLFYKRSELAYRVGLQISAAPLATSFASSLAWVIVKLSQNGPIAPWRVLFLVEGFPSVLTAVAAWYYIPDSPAKARYLTPRERKVAVMRLQSEQHHSHAFEDSASHGINVKDVLATVRDPKSYLTALMFLSVNVSFSSLPVFLPTIINSMSFSPLASQALAAPPYLFAFFFVLAVGRYSDKIPDSRSLFLMGAALLSAVSYAGIALAGLLHESIGEAGSITIRYVAVYGAAMGLFASVTLIITWTLNNQASSTSKGTGLTILNIVGQCGPLIGVHVFPKSQGPFYVQGMAVCAGFMAIGVAGLAGVLRLVLHRANKRNGLSHPATGGEYELVGMVAGDTEDDQRLVGSEDVEETLIGGARKVNTKNAGFRYML